MNAKPIVLTVTGGKGGTGKTVVSVNLAVMFKNKGYRVLLVDGDVENPNTYLLMDAKLQNSEPVKVFTPVINTDKCEKCGLCSKNCLSHALLFVKDAFPIPITNVCSGCKLCYKICPTNAIEPEYRIIGNTYFTSINDIDLLIGEIIPTEAKSAVIVEALMDKIEKIKIESKNSGKKGYDIIILDSAPGAHCDVELLIDKGDYIITITEPTKFGKHDLVRIIELIKLLNKKFYVVINRSSLPGYKKEFMSFLNEKKYPILGEIPLDNDILSSYCNATPLMDERNDYDKNSPGYIAFKKLFEQLQSIIKIQKIKVHNK
ncbi:MAG: P-loop NTPase [Promethearchaeia archaeon]